MRCKERRKKPGDVWPVSQSYHYPLPPELEAGTRVKLLSYDHGYWTVEADGKQFVVFGPQVDAGYFYELNGRWLPADDPRVIAAKKAWANQSVARTPQNPSSGCSLIGVPESIPSRLQNAAV